MAISWDYEETRDPYYQIYAIGGPLDGVLEVIVLNIPRAYDREVQAIADALKALETKMKENSK
jgi:hypothetical protein